MQLTPQDELLMDRIKQNDTRALDVLFELYYDSICAVIYYFTNQKELSEELGADVFIRLWDKRNTIVIDKDVRAYLLAMARNAALGELKRKKRPVIGIETAETIRPFISSAEDPERRIILQESAALISGAVNSIKDDTRIIFCLSRTDGLKYREIAELLNISEKTVEHHMGKALRYLKSRLHHVLMNTMLILLIIP